MNTYALLPRLLIISPTLAFAIESFVYVIQYFHSSRFSDSSFHSITSYIANISAINKLRFELIQGLLNLLVTLLLWLVIGPLWKDYASRSMARFVLVYDIFLLIFQQIPERALKTYFIDGREVSYFSIILDLFFEMLNGLLAQYILVGILYLIAKYSKLQPIDDDEEQNNNENVDNNNEEGQNANENNENQERTPSPQRCSCCIGRFWLIFLILGISVIFLVNMFIVDYLMMDKTDFVEITNQTIAGPLKNLTDKVDFPFENVYMQLSLDPNAFYTGIFDKRVIIIAKKLIQLVSDPMDLCAVVAHELGHWKHKDLVKSFIFSLIVCVLLCLTMKVLSSIGLSSIGLGHDVPVLIFMLCISTLFMFPQLVIMVTLNIMTRNFESNADCFAAQLGYPIAEALTILTNGVYGGDLESAEIYSLFYENHPPLSKRVAHIQKCIAVK